MKYTIIIISFYILAFCISSVSFAAEQAAPSDPVPGQQAPVLGQPAQSTRAGAGSARTSQASGQNGQEGQDAQALFEESLKRMMPLSGEQIEKYRDRSNQRDKALLPVSPTLGSRTVRVSLEPGRAPVKVFTTANIATSLVFHDSTGQPWPVTSVTNGGPKFFQILRPELPDGNLLNVMPLQAYGTSTIVVTLAKRDVPLVIRLESDSVRSPKRKADAMVLFQLVHEGPNAQTPIIQDTRETVSSAMLAFLDHVPPSGAVRVQFEPADDKVEIWKFNNAYYIRTIHTLMWPAWISVVHGAGGMKCYESSATSRILLSKNGAINAVRIKEKIK